MKNKKFDNFLYFLFKNQESKYFRIFNYLISLFSLVFIVNIYLNLNNEFNLKINFLEIAVLFINYIFAIKLWINYCETSSKDSKKDSLAQWCSARLSRYVPGGVAFFGVRLSQKTKTEQNKKEIFFGLIEEHLIAPVLIIITFLFIFIFPNILNNLFIFFFVFTVIFFISRFLYLKKLKKGNSIFKKPTFLYLSIVSFFIFLNIVASNSIENNPIYYALNYHFSTSVSLLFVGVPVGIGIRESLFYLISFDSIDKYFLMFYMVKVRLYILILDLIFGLYGNLKILVMNKLKNN